MIETFWEGTRANSDELPKNRSTDKRDTDRGTDKMDRGIRIK